MTLCDDSPVIDPASGRAVSRDLHAAAFRRGRHWPSLCVPEAVVLSLPWHPSHGTESTAGLPLARVPRQLGERPRSSPRSRAGPAARGIALLRKAHPIMNLTLVYRGRSKITSRPAGSGRHAGAEPEARPRRLSTARSAPAALPRGHRRAPRRRHQRPALQAARQVGLRGLQGRAETSRSRSAAPGRVADGGDAHEGESPDLPGTRTRGSTEPSRQAPQVLLERP